MIDIAVRMVRSEMGVRGNGLYSWVTSLKLRAPYRSFGAYHTGRTRDRGTGSFIKVQRQSPSAAKCVTVFVSPSRAPEPFRRRPNRAHVFS